MKRREIVFFALGIHGRRVVALVNRSAKGRNLKRELSRKYFEEEDNKEEDNEERGKIYRTLRFR